jgi:septation ring formation regulator EzrA
MPTYVLLGAAGITGICIASVVFVGLLVLSFFFLHKRKFKSTYKNLRKTYDTYHTQLEIDCGKMVSRLKVLGQYNESFNAMYLERQKQYDDIKKKRDDDINLSLNSLETLVKDKDYKGYKRIEEETIKALDDFEKAVCNFSADLSTILQEDNDVHSNAVAVKGKYREIKDFYNDHQSELNALAAPFEKIFVSSEQQFSDFEKKIDEAKYEEAKNILAGLDKLYEAVLAVLKDLPSLEVLVTTVIPAKLNSLEADYKKMIDEQYVVTEMHVDQKISDMRKEISDIQKQLMYLDIRGVKDRLSALQTKITDVLAGFEEERKAKDIYFSKKNSLSDSSFSVEKRYARLMNSLPEYQNTFILDNKYVSQMKTLKADIESIGILKRELDSYLDTSARKPYVIITKKMTEMDNEMTKTVQVMDDYANYLQSLKDDSSYVFSQLRECFVRLKKTQNLVRNMRITSYTKTVQGVFDEDFATIREINSILITAPIDVPLAKSKFASFSKSLEGFINSVNTTIDEAKKAESAIVYANAYRVDYSDSRSILSMAEQSFLEGDFTRATSLAVNVVKTFSGGVAATD